MTPVSPRRMAAFAIDVVGLSLLFYVAFRICDRSTATNVALHPPIQAARAAARLIPVWAVLYALWVVLPGLLWSASVGKRVLGLRVISSDDGQSLGAVRTVLRETIGKWMSVATNGFGFLEVFITGTTLHDRLLRSEVVARGDEDDIETSTADEWSAAAPIELGAVMVGFALLYWSMRTQGIAYGLFWRGAFYVPHEAGHLVFGFVFPHLVAVAAGGWAQNFFPAVALIVFTLRRSLTQAVGAALWLSLSLFDIARYARDAWERALPLPVAVGDELTEEHLNGHDWWQLLSAADVLRYAQMVGDLIGALGWALAAASIGGAICVITSQRHRR